jgi:putative membrane protein
MGMGVGPFGLVLMVLFWGGLIALGMWLVRALFPQVGQPPAESPTPGVDAREILERRYARGEISRAEYDLMKETLSQ